MCVFSIDIDDWGVSPRGAGFLFGSDVVARVHTHTHTHTLKVTYVLLYIIVQCHKLYTYDLSCTSTSNGRLQVALLRDCTHSMVST